MAPVPAHRRTEPRRAPGRWRSSRRSRRRTRPRGVTHRTGGEAHEYAHHANWSTRAPGTAPPTTPAKRRPSTAGYWVGALIAVLATLGAIVWGAFAFLGWRAHVEDFPHLTPPDTAVVSVADTGAQFVYLEHDRSTAVPAVPAVTVTGPSGAEVPLTAYQGEMRYDVPGVANRSAMRR